MKSWFFYAVLTGSLMLSGPVCAATETTSLENIVVTGSRIAEEQKEVPQTIITIDNEEIEASTAENVADLLAEKGIGHVHKYPAGNTSVGIRGFRTDTHGNDLKGHILVLLNGRRAGTGNLTKFLTRNIERIEIIRGPGAVQYGSAGMGGVINIITKRGKSDSEGFVELGVGSYERVDEKAGFATKSGKVDFSMAFSHSDINSYKTAAGDTYENTNIDDQVNVSLNLGYQINPEHHIAVIGNLYDAETGNYSSFSSNSDNNDYADKTNRSVDFIYDGSSRDATYSWQARYYLGQDNNDYHYTSKSDSLTQVDQRGAQLQGTADYEKLRLTFGSDWLDYDVDATSSGRSDYRNLAFFLLGKSYWFDDNLILSAGIRRDGYDISGAGTSRDESDFTASAGAVYLLGSHWKLMVNYGEAFVMPTAEATLMDVSYYGGYYIYEGNADLDPERSKTYEAGIAYADGASDISLTGFYTDYRDKIVSQYQGTVSGSHIYTYINVSEATMSGLEGRVSYDIGKALNWSLSVKPYVSFVHLFDYEDGETGEDLQYVSDDTLSMGMNVSAERFRVNLVLTYTGEQQVYNWSAGEEQTKGGFSVVNMSTALRVSQCSAGELWWKAEVNNLLDKDYEYVVGYPMAGRNFYTSFEFRF